MARIGRPRRLLQVARPEEVESVELLEPETEPDTAEAVEMDQHAD